MKEEFKETINGYEYKIYVSEHEDRYGRKSRCVTVIDLERRLKGMGGYHLVRDDRKDKHGGLFSESEPIPGRAEHVSDAITAAVARREGRDNEIQEFRDDIQAVLDAADEVFSE